MPRNTPKPNRNGKFDTLSRNGSCRAFTDILAGRSQQELNLGYFTGAMLSRGWSEKQFTKKMKLRFTSWIGEKEERAAEVLGWRQAAHHFGFEVEGIDGRVAPETCTFWKDINQDTVFSLYREKPKLAKRKRAAVKAEAEVEGADESDGGDGGLQAVKKLKTGMVRVPSIEKMTQLTKLHAAKDQGSIPSAGNSPKAEDKEDEEEGIPLPVVNTEDEEEEGIVQLAVNTEDEEEEGIVQLAVNPEAARPLGWLQSILQGPLTFAHHPALDLELGSFSEQEEDGTYSN